MTTSNVFNGQIFHVTVYTQNTQQQIRSACHLLSLGQASIMLQRMEKCVNTSTTKAQDDGKDGGREGLKESAGAIKIRENI